MALEYNLGGLANETQEIENCTAEIKVLKTKLDDMIARLEPNWTSPAGKQRVQENRNFSNVDVESYIQHLNGRIANLQSSSANLNVIDRTN